MERPVHFQFSFIFKFTCMRTCLTLHQVETMPVEARGGFEILELELQTVVCSLMWVRELNPSPLKAASALRAEPSL